MMSKYECIPCKTSYKSQPNYDNHQLTDTHKIQEQVYNRKMAKTQSSNEIIHDEEDNAIFTPKKCELCNLPLLTKLGYEKHFESKRHLQNVEAEKNKQLKAKGEWKPEYICEDCNKEYFYKNRYDNHLKSAEHTKTLMKKQEAIAKEEQKKIKEEQTKTKEKKFTYDDDGIAYNTDKLPKGIHYTQKGFYYYIDGDRVYHNDLIEAIENKEKYYKEQKQKRLNEILSKPINRNSNGVAIIDVNKKGKIKVAETQVDDDIYYDLVKWKWSLSIPKKMEEYKDKQIMEDGIYKHGYKLDVRGRIDNVSWTLARYIVNCSDLAYEVIHIDGDSLNNRRENLAIIETTSKANKSKSNKQKQNTP